MKKIHITEAQLKELKKRLTEEDEITVDAHPDQTGKISTQSLTQQYQNAKKNVTANTNVNMKVDGSDLMENVAEAWADTVDMDSNVTCAAPKDFQKEMKNEGGYAQVMEGKCVTKKQIRQAKIKKLQENSVRFTKKDLY